MPKYETRFENFFVNLRLNRAEFGDMAAYTLRALRQANPTNKYQDLIAPLDAALAEYAATHAGQLSGAAKESTLLVSKQMEAFREYVRRVERKHINPSYDAGTPDLLAIFPKGRTALTNSSQTTVLDNFTAFLQALDARDAVFAQAVREEGRALHARLSQALQVAAGHAQTLGELSNNLTDGRQALCGILLRVYATLLAEHATAPARVAAFFDFSAVTISSKAVRKAAA